jgi:hypothetical protein
MLGSTGATNHDHQFDETKRNVTREKVWLNLKQF